jgi:hypothetical protein
MELDVFLIAMRRNVEASISRTSSAGDVLCAAMTFSAEE